MHVSVPAIPPGKLTGKYQSESSSIIQNRVQKARDIQIKRFRSLPIKSNAEMGSRLMKQQPYIIANALAVTTTIIYVICRVLVGLFPDVSFIIAQSWFHGIELSKLDSWNLTMSSFVLGLISSTISAWVIGYIFAKVYKLFIK